MREIFVFTIGEELASRRRQGGAAAVEFALVAIIFLMLLIGSMEFSRWLFTLNAASEATRFGARLAVVCDKTDAQKNIIKTKMQLILRNVTDKDKQINIEYVPGACDTPQCTITVSLKDVTVASLIPFLGGTFKIPEYTVKLPRESLDSADGSNEVCK